MTSYKISELLKYRPTAKDIKDYSKVTEIFCLYMNEKLDTMTREIAEYGRFEFFLDLSRFLMINMSKESWQKFLYEDILNEYTYRIVEYKLKPESWDVKRKKTKRSVSY